jgi:hypothetical protein
LKKRRRKVGKLKKGKIQRKLIYTGKTDAKEEKIKGGKI